MHLPRKLLIQMSGAPGSGKSTVASLLAPSMNAVVINHDLIKAFFLENGISFDHSGKLTYIFDWRLAEDIIKQGWNVIIDSTCNYNEVLNQGIALAREYDYDYWYVECKADNIDLLDQRLHDRVPLRSQRTGVDRPPPDASAARHSEDNRALFKKWIEDPCRPTDNAIVVDSTGSPEECLDYILKRISPSNPATLKSRFPEGGFAGGLEPSIATALGGAQAFTPSNPVPQILPSGHGYVGDYSAVN